MRAFHAFGRLGTIPIVLAALSCSALSSPTGDAVEDIIDGCNQFIKLSHKGRSREDAVTMSRMGECLGAVRTMLATEIAADAICPAKSFKLVDAVTTFSLYMIRHPDDLKAVYVVPMRQAFRAAYPCDATHE